MGQNQVGGLHVILTSYLFDTIPSVCTNILLDIPCYMHMRIYDN